MEYLSGDEEIPDTDSLWTQLPFHVFNKIALLLDLNSIRSCISTCKDWRQRLQEDIIWKKILMRYCNIQEFTTNPKKDSVPWHTEFKNLLCKPPTYLYMTLSFHVDEVLHVNISPNGKWIASSSRDKNVCICAIEEHTVTLSKKLSFGQRWDYIQFCDFSPDSSHLMVSGVLKAHAHFSGEIMVFNVHDIISSNSDSCASMVENNPYDVFGSWLNEKYFIAGKYVDADIFVPSVSELWIHSVDNSVHHKLMTLENNLLGSTVRNVLSTECSLGDLKELLDSIPTCNCKFHEIHDLYPFHCGNCSKIVSSQVLNKANCSDTRMRCSKYLLIFTHGNVSHVPHQAIIKHIILPDSMKHHIHYDSNITWHQLEEGISELKSVTIDVQGQIIGLVLSPNRRQLLMNCRLWVNKHDIVFEDPMQPPEISNDITLQTYDVLTGALLQVFSGHHSFTGSMSCFFIFLDANEEYVASGAEDSKVHIWHRRYGKHIIPQDVGHNDVVNMVKFNPQRPGMLVSASDDNELKVWLSRDELRKMKDCPNDLRNLVPKYITADS